uniref:SRCR domain-containing protein n=1 Tax=Amphimedon queenslandica TaxID=400682 RepID=A0A1X7UHA5_AMPQE
MHGVPLSPIDVSRICLYSLGISSGFVGRPAGVMAPPLNLTRDLGRVVTGFDCTDLENCTNTTMYGDCGSNGYATVTCQRVCIDDDDGHSDVFLFNQYSGVEGGSSYIAGIPQFCANGAPTRVCNDGTNSPRIINFACEALNYQYGQLLSYNASVYNGTPPGVVYLSNFSCPTSDINSCGDYANFATDSRCFGGSLEYFVKCYNDTQNCNMPGVTFFTNFSSNNFGQQLLSGIAVMCINGHLVPLCNENDDDYDSDDIDLVCTSMGFDGGSIRPPNPSRYGPGPQGVGYYGNFSCPSNATDTSSCTATMTNNTQCIGGLRELVIECYLGTPTTPSTTATSAPTSTATATQSITTSATRVVTTTGGASVTPSSTPTESSSSKVGLAVGVTIAVLVVVGLIVAAVIIVVFIVIRKRRSGSFSF